MVRSLRGSCSQHPTPAHPSSWATLVWGAGHTHPSFGQLTSCPHFLSHLHTGQLLDMALPSASQPHTADAARAAVLTHLALTRQRPLWSHRLVEGSQHLGHPGLTTCLSRSDAAPTPGRPKFSKKKTHELTLFLPTVKRIKTQIKNKAS